MLRLGVLLFFATIVFGQVPGQRAVVWIEIGDRGDLHATLSAPIDDLPPAVPIAVAGAMGCEVPASEPRADPRIQMRCTATHPTKLTFHSIIRIGQMAPLLRHTGVGTVDLVLNTPSFNFLRIAPVIPSQGTSRGFNRAQFAVDQLPPEIIIDGGFEMSRVRALLVCAAGLMLTPFLLLVLRPSDLLRLRVQLEGIFVLAWICWIWVLMRDGAGPLLTYVFGQWNIGALLVLLVPPLVAVWIGSRLAALQHDRLAPNGLSAVDYRRVRFWTGAAAVCFVSTILNLLLSPASHAFGSLILGLILTMACLVCLKRMSRGGSRPLAEGDLRTHTFAFAAKAGVRLRGVSILTSPTPRPPLAFAARWGVILLNEALLARLSRREVDAIVCHELSHLSRSNRSTRTVLCSLMAVSVLGTMWIPHFGDFIPLALLAAYFLFKRWRRVGEFKADLNSVKWCGDAEAMITGLARVSHEHNMPLTWGAPMSWMLSHPPTVDRVQGIAKACGMSDVRLAELLEESRRDAVDHYVEAGAALIPEDAAFSPALRKQLETRLSLYLLLAPALCGLPVVWLLERCGLAWWVVVSLGSLVSMAAIYLCAEWISGAVRATVKQRSVARHGPGVLAGFSPSAQPRLFDGGYHYDLGMVRFVEGRMEFAGDRANFFLDPRLVRRTWLGDGPRHWTPRKVVYIECRPSLEAGLATFSLQSVEAWFWPSTVTGAKRLYQDIEAWRTATPSPPTPLQPCALPQVEGNPVPCLPVRTALRWIGIYCGVGFLLASLETSVDLSTGLWNPFRVFLPPVVCGVLAFFVVWPRLGRNPSATVTSSSASDVSASRN